MKPRFFVSKSYLAAGAVIDHMWVFTSTESTFIYTQKDGSVRIVEVIWP
jgi:ribosome biogenesis protein Nip4